MRAMTDHDDLERLASPELHDLAVSARSAISTSASSGS
jgi:hypothetical protein